MKKSSPGSQLREVNRRWKNGDFLRDPTFGYTGALTTGYSLDNCIRGIQATLGENGYAQSISAYVCVIDAGTVQPHRTKAALYDAASALKGVTEERTLAAGDWRWETWNFSPLVYLAAATYRIVAWAEDTGGYCYIGYGAVSGWTRVAQTRTYDAFPDPASFTSSANQVHSIYCTYTTAVAAARPVLMDGLVVL